MLYHYNDMKIPITNSLYNNFYNYKNSHHKSLSQIRKIKVYSINYEFVPLPLASRYRFRVNVLQRYRFYPNVTDRLSPLPTVLYRYRPSSTVTDRLLPLPTVFYRYRPSSTVTDRYLIVYDRFSAFMTVFSPFITVF